MNWESKIFQNHSLKSFTKISLEVFNFQAKKNIVYKNFIKNLGVETSKVRTLNDIPFLPIELFKTHDITCHKGKHDVIFTSSGTKGKTSKHLVKDIGVYEKSFIKNFSCFYGAIKDYTILALLPSYLERSGSSLIYMCNQLIQKSQKKESGFYLNEYEKLYQQIFKLEQKKEKTILIGVSFGLLDFIKYKPLKLKHTIIIETGGMKGRRKEIIREELHDILCKGFHIKSIDSEYGMTELLSQAYAKNSPLFKCPPWMKVHCRDISDPFSKNINSGALNIIDLANVYSCSFIASQDLAKIYKNGCFEILGRMDNSDIRGCNLMIF